MGKRLTHGIIIIVVIGTLAIITMGLLRPVSSGSVDKSNQHSDGKIQVGLQKGDAAPNFTLMTADGQKVSLSDYRGKPVMLNFWMINCEGCQYEMPGMEKVYTGRQGAQKDLVMLGIDASDPAMDINQFALHILMSGSYTRCAALLPHILLTEEALSIQAMKARWMRGRYARLFSGSASPPRNDNPSLFEHFLFFIFTFCILQAERVKCKK